MADKKGKWNYEQDRVTKSPGNWQGSDSGEKSASKWQYVMDSSSKSAKERAEAFKRKARKRKSSSKKSSKK